MCGARSAGLGFIGIATLAIAVAVAARPTAALASRSAADRALDRLVERFEVVVERDRGSGFARFVRAADGSATDLAPGKDAALEHRARDFFALHGAAFGIDDPTHDLDLAAERVDRFGFRHLTFRQFHRGIPVFAAELRAHFDSALRLRSVQGVFVSGLDVDVVPRVGAERGVEIARRFVASVRARPGALLSTGAPRLEILRRELERGRRGSDHLVWRVEVDDGGDLRTLVFVDAHRGKVVDEQSRVRHERFRRAYSGVDQAPLNGIPDSWPDAPDWVEGDPAPTGTAELDSALAASADVHRFFAALGSDSYDGQGHSLDISWNHATSCPNASWNGRLASFCSGFAVHDVVAHEWGHAWTQFSSDLIYRWQSGALNESYSDVWGEILDQATKLYGTKDTDAPATVRPVESCSAYRQARLEIVSPAGIAGDYPVGLAAFGSAILPSGAGVRLVRARDGAGSDPRDGCEPLVNGAELAGALAFLERGACEFQVQARHAQQAEAVGLVVGNHADSPDPEEPPAMGCDPVFACDLSITIPAVSLASSDADRLRSVLPAWVGAAIRPGDNEGAAESVRWLLGEDVRPHGPVRDMWRPPCFDDPGRTSDPEYHCAASDGGGVHINSGIPNHAFALLVDGGTFNGREVVALGRARAAQLYWRALTVYLTPASDFSDQAAALEAACEDLRGTPLPDPFGGPPVTLTAAHCGEVADAVAAVELRMSPDCAFEPILDPGPVPFCAAGAPYVWAAATFESGSQGWTTLRREVADPETFDPRDWSRVGALPDQRPGVAFFAPDPNVGDCVTGQSGDDDSGVLVLESPQFTLPTGAPARLAFDHFLATEGTWDGGNVKLLRASGDWELLPAESFAFNPYPSALRSPEMNTNPLAGEGAFHGADEGSNSGSWGSSVVDLSGRVIPGEPFRLRFELGTDLCFGTDLGWWVDDVRLYTCAAPGALFLDGFETGAANRWSTVAP